MAPGFCFGSKKLSGSSGLLVLAGFGASAGCSVLRLLHAASNARITRQESARRMAISVRCMNNRTVPRAVSRHAIAEKSVVPGVPLVRVQLHFSQCLLGA